MIDAYNRERDLHINRASFFDVHASRQSLHLFFCLFVFWKCLFFRVFLYHYSRFVVVLYGKYVARFPLLDDVVYLVTTGWNFDIITRRLVQRGCNNIKSMQWKDATQGQHNAAGIPTGPGCRAAQQG